MTANLKELVVRYKADSESVYNTWFIQSEARMKAFRSIRRGIAEVIQGIKEGTFGNDFKGSPLEGICLVLVLCKKIRRRCRFFLRAIQWGITRFQYIKLVIAY